jgi:FkbM family methyltransferase
MFVSPDAALHYWKPRVERTDPRLLNSALEVLQKGDVVWDVGANVGLFSFVAAGLVGPAGRVLAIKPDLWLAGLLRRSAGVNVDGFAPVDVLPVAIAEAADIQRFHVAQRGRASNHLAKFGYGQAGGSREVQFVPTVTLDWLLERFPAPRVLKIDVEGAETEALRGGGEEFFLRRSPLFCAKCPQKTGIGSRKSCTVTGMFCLMQNCQRPNATHYNGRAGTRWRCPKAPGEVVMHHASAS